MEVGFLVLCVRWRSIHIDPETYRCLTSPQTPVLDFLDKRVLRKGAVGALTHRGRLSLLSLEIEKHSAKRKRCVRRCKTFISI